MSETNYAANANGTTFTFGGNNIMNLTKIGGIELTADAQDVSILANDWKEYISGKPDGGEVTLEGFFYSGDTNGQVAIGNAIGATSSTACSIDFPAAIAATWSFDAVVTSFMIGDVEQEGGLPWSATLKISGQPTLSISTSTGLTTPFFTISDSAVITPAASGSVYEYVASVLTGVSSVTVTPTATAGTITVNGNTVATGVASSAITLGSAGSVTDITIIVTETGKIPKTYVIHLARL